MKSKGKEHRIQRLATGRSKYPFKSMIIGDYFLLLSAADAQRARSAATSYCRGQIGKMFEVKGTGWNQWTCKRVH